MISVIRTGEYPIVRTTTDRDTQTIIPIGDTHVGSKTFNEKLLKRIVQRVVDTNAFVVLMGDMIENATKRSIGAGVYEQVLAPKDQIRLIYELLKPIPKENFIGGILGNHEDRTLKDSGIDLMMVLCDMLDIPYLGNELFAIVSRPDQIAYTIYANHSLSGSKTKGLVENSIERDWMRWIDADIILKGHDHNLSFSSPIPTYRIDANSVAVVERERYIVLTGSCLSRAGSYATAVPYSPKPMGAVEIELTMKQHQRNVKGTYIR